MAGWKLSAEELLILQVASHGLPKPVREYRFHPTRRWRFDLAWPDERLAVEIEGGLWVRGRHNRAAGYERDMEKYNEATLLGWKLLRFSPKMVETGIALRVIKRALGKEKV